MSYFEIFDSRNRHQRRQHVLNLLSIALKQGPLDPVDSALLFKTGIRGGIGPMELYGILRQGRYVPFTMPASPRACLEQLYDVVLILMNNGSLHPSELTLCKAIARRLGFPEPAVEPMIGEMFHAINDGQAAEVTIGKLID